MENSDKNLNLKDLIYFDEDKASSLLSQVEGGLPQELRESSEVSEDKRSVKKADLKVFKGEFGGIEIEKMSTMQRKILHHDLLNRIETFLNEKNLVLDLNIASKEIDTLNAKSIRNLIKGEFFVRAEGYCDFNDFVRLKKIMNNFQFLVDFVNKSNKYAIRESQEYKELKNQIEDFKADIKNIKDRNEKTRQKELVKHKEKELEQTFDEMTEEVEAPEEWIFEGYSKWVKIFNERQIHLRLKPFKNFKDFVIISNLIRDYFIESDIEHLLFSYGQKPDVKFTILGSISSKPSLKRELNEMRKLEDGTDTQNNSLVQFENAILNLFDSMEGIEAFGRFTTYPNITVYPIAVYREVSI